MAVSPRSELRIVSITEFSHVGEGNTPGTPWEFEQQDVNCEVILKREGFDDLNQAVRAFFEAIDYNPAIVIEDDTAAHFSDLVHVGDERYHIREYAYGAPNPFPVDRGD